MSTKNNRLFLITGATGNTGDTTVRLLLQRGHRVRSSGFGRDTAETLFRAYLPVDGGLRAV